tara:strand:- start:1006 stop:1188 length:183 start_codon:yes stop_codon:yes gene_type:complete
MTKKDYIKVAEILKEAKNNTNNWKLRNEDVIKNLVDEFSIMFKLDNRRFDKVKFVDYINN